MKVKDQPLRTNALEDVDGRGRGLRLAIGDGDQIGGQTVDGVKRQNGQAG